MVLDNQAMITDCCRIDTDPYRRTCPKCGWEFRAFDPNTDLIKLVKAADQLENYLGSNSGHTSDWPIHVSCDERKCAETLVRYLTELNSALKPYREITK